ncbi:MAG: hypothetical protein IJ565_03550 [Bacilli bacterium]|nr:hypothetical protein [Bacilli bacterium]
MDTEKIKYFLIGFISATMLFVLIILVIVFIGLKEDAPEPVNPIKEIGNFECEVINEIRNTFNSEIVINDGHLYKINPNMKYSNEQNCKLVSDVNIVRVVDNYYIGSDNTVYTYDADNDELKVYDSAGRIPAYLFGDDVVMASNYGGMNQYKYYVLKTDGKIYKVKFNREFIFTQGSYSYTVISDEVFKEYEDELIKSFNVFNKNINFITTNNGIYNNKITNMECLEYADVECNLEFTKSEILEEFMDNITYINIYNNNSVIYVDKNNRIFSFSMLGN